MSFNSILLVLMCCAAATFAQAAPGAHGPNGEHLDRPAATAGAAGSVPRFEAKSEAFEMVGRLQGGELSIFVNRYDSNEPVLNAKLEVEAGPRKAMAPFRTEQGDYVVADKDFVAVLSQPGEHALVLTLNAGAEADLLDAALAVAGPARARADHGHEHGLLEEAAAPLAVIGGALLLAALGWMLRRRRSARTLGAAQ